ncbi:hypothetical protein Lal_00013914 [Lupinus albus]|nr:hypothetical protein Lal_00013914 [Lupinus albus]
MKFTIYFFYIFFRYDFFATNFWVLLSRVLHGFFVQRDSRLSEKGSPGGGEILDYTGGFSPERELSRLGEKWQFWAVDTV